MNLKSKEGSISIFVLVALLFMAGFLIISFGSNVNKSKVLEEQFNIISEIYSYSSGYESAYEKAYTDLRNKNRQKMVATTEGTEDTASIELTKTFAEKIVNYRIYGNGEGVGDLVDDVTDANYGKYKLKIRIIDEHGNDTITNIYLNEYINAEEYIDFKLERVIRNDGEEEITKLPELSTFEDYTKIEVLTEVKPSRIDIEYMGYTLE